MKQEASYEGGKALHWLESYRSIILSQELQHPVRDTETKSGFR